ncbi:PQQ-binding-like beta-propeller repeat protein [Candidatus Latescibacterota bacterium]
MIRKKHIVLTVMLLLLVSNVSLSADWPQYLGPNRNAVSTETGLLRSWPEDGPSVLWTAPLGQGFGGAIVSNGMVYVLDRVGNEQDMLRCFDLSTGTQEWTFAYDAPGELDHPGSRSVSTIDGNNIYTCGSFGHVKCIDIRTYQAVWEKNVWTDFDGQRVPRWGIAQNPLIYGDLLIVASQSKKAGVVAYDKRTGSVQWASPALPGSEGYVSPKLINIEGDDQLVMIPASGPIMGMSPETGKMLWTYDGWQCKIPAANVTEIGDGRIFITGGYRAGSAMIKVEKENDVFVVREIYKTQEFGTHVHPAILYMGHLYAHCSTNDRRDGMVCMDLDGNVRWKTKRSPLFDKGGFILVDGLILSVDGNNGFLYLIEPNPDEFKELASAKLLDTDTCWAPLALSGGKLLIRDQKQMKCVVVSE